MASESINARGAASAPRAGTRRKRRSRFVLAPYILLAPFVVLFAAFLVYPVIGSFVAAFSGAPRSTDPGWVGWANFERVLADPVFGHAVVNTLFFVAVTGGIIFPISFGLALIVRPLWVRGQTIFRVLMIIPAVVAPVVSTIVFQILLGADGLLNGLLTGLIDGYQKIDWLNDETWSRWAVALIFMWTWTGFTMIYFVAGLATVPKELEEAATVDGANAWRRVRSIIWPHLQPIRLLVLILILQGAGQIFDVPKVIAGSGNGPGNSLVTLTMYVFNTGFGQGDAGLANAAALLMMLALLVGSALLLSMHRDNTRSKRA